MNDDANQTDDAATIEVVIPGQIARWLTQSPEYRHQYPEGLDALHAGVWQPRGQGQALWVQLGLDAATDLDSFLDVVLGDGHEPTGEMAPPTPREFRRFQQRVITAIDAALAEQIDTNKETTE